MYKYVHEITNREAVPRDYFKRLEYYICIIISMALHLEFMRFSCSADIRMISYHRKADTTSYRKTKVSPVETFNSSNEYFLR